MFAQFGYRPNDLQKLCTASVGMYGLFMPTFLRILIKRKCEMGFQVR